MKTIIRIFVIAIITAPLSAMQTTQFQQINAGFQGIVEYLQGKAHCTIAPKEAIIADQFIQNFNGLIVPLLHKQEFKGKSSPFIIEQLQAKVNALRAVPEQTIGEISNRPFRYNHERKHALLGTLLSPLIGAAIGSCWVSLAEQYPEALLLPTGIAALNTAYTYVWTWQKNRQLKEDAIAYIKEREKTIQEPIYPYPNGINRLSLLDGLERQLDCIIKTCSEIAQKDSMHSLSQNGRAAEECPICFEVGELDAQTHCNHRFHANCLTLWLSDNNTCPLCRNSITD
ncbi:MAG: RING finger domain-containing protein [Candidatus Babeliales bacterium]